MRHLNPRTVFLACMVGGLWPLAAGIGLSSASAATGDSRTRHPGKVVRKCANLRGTFVLSGSQQAFSSGDGVIVIDQVACRKIIYREGNGSAVALILDDKPRK